MKITFQSFQLEFLCWKAVDEVKKKKKHEGNSVSNMTV
jgi:hypothetical protein